MSGRPRCLAVVRAAVVALLVAFAAPSRPLQGRPLEVAVDADCAWVRTGDAALLQYRYGDVTFKPYVRELFTPSGLNILLDSPPDHIHHHGLMFAYAVDGVTYWAEYAGQPPSNPAAVPGKQKHERFSDVAVTQMGGVPWGCFSESIHWISPGRDKPSVFEQRTIAATRLTEPAVTLVTWKCELAAAPGRDSVELTGSHYYGLGLRFIRAMDATGEFSNADGKPGVIFRGEERLVRSAWCVYTAQADGHDVTVAMFGDPDNPRHPATWFMMARPFAYLAATLRLHEEPLQLDAGKPLNLCYGVALWDDRVTPAQIDRLYHRWVDMVRSNEAKR